MLGVWLGVCGVDCEVLTDLHVAGNCWFVAATAALAASDWKLLHRVVPQDQSFDVDYAGTS